ncbi:MAG: hypothetical protein ACKPHU_29120, partial [Planctomycetaceae bacterium]
MNQALTTDQRFQQCATAVQGLLQAVQQLQRAAVLLQTDPVEATEWHQLLRQKLAPQLGQSAFLAAAVVGGTINVDGVEPTHMKAFIDLLDQLGVDYAIEADPTDATRKSLRVSGLPAGGAYKPTNIRTQPFPGLATDLQPSAGLM